jgi:hypothetical protein
MPAIWLTIKLFFLPSSLSAQEKPLLRISRCLTADASLLKGGFSDEELLTTLCLEAFFVSFVALWWMSSLHDY